MTIDVKICGLRDREALEACIEAGARYTGFVFYPKSPRAIDVSEAASLITPVSHKTISVGLFVDPSDDQLRETLRVVPLRMIQLHGSEPPRRVADIKSSTGLPVIKAVGIATAEDVGRARSYDSATDMLLLDARAPQGAQPGGNAMTFDWSLLRGRTFARPWILAGGLNWANIAEAVNATGARIVDVSSGVEDASGRKNISKIRGFIASARGIETSC